MSYLRTRRRRVCMLKRLRRRKGREGQRGVLQYIYICSLNITMNIQTCLRSTHIYTHTQLTHTYSHTHTRTQVHEWPLHCIGAGTGDRSHFMTLAKLIILFKRKEFNSAKQASVHTRPLCPCSWVVIIIITFTHNTPSNIARITYVDVST